MIVSLGRQQLPAIPFHRIRNPFAPSFAWAFMRRTTPLPTMAPWARPESCATWAGLEMPKPTQMGRSVS